MPVDSTLSPSVVVSDSLAVADRSTATGESPLRVLHVVNGEHYAGAERVQDLLALRLPELGVDVGFACLKPDRFPRSRQCQSTPLYETPMRGRFDLATARRVAEIVRRDGYQLVHAHTARSALVGRAASWLAGVPLVCHVHSPTSRDTTQRLRNWMNAGIERLSFAGVARLIAVSESLGEHLRRLGYRADRISVVHNGVPSAGPLTSRPAPRDVWTIGTVALMRPRKGIEVLIDALAILRQKNLAVRLRAIGPFETPQYEQELRRRADRLGLDEFIDWTGFTSDVNGQLARLDLFVLPSLFGEGLPMVVLEAMTAGVPVVATRVEGIPEAVRDGLDGALAEPRDPADLARQIERVVQGELDWSALRASAHARHAEKFSDRAMAAGVAAAYRRVMAPATA